MLDEEHRRLFQDSLQGSVTGPLADLLEKCRREDVPVIRGETQNVLRVILEAQKPTAVLEIGTAIGFSSVFMCTFSDARVTTIENYPVRVEEARETIRSFHMEERIHLLEGDAQKILPALQGPYDLIFMDAAKGQYPVFYKEVRRLLKTGGLLLTDNILQEGEVLDSRFAVERRNRTIHRRMRDYLHMLMRDDEMTTCVLPVGDGLAVSVKKLQEKEIQGE